MEFIDARRLTGSNLLWDKPGSILDVRCSSDEADMLIPQWRSLVEKMLDAVGWGQESTTFKKLTSGVSLAFSAPIDALYAATEINQWAWQCCLAAQGQGEVRDFGEACEQIKSLIIAEQNSALLSLQREAKARDVTFLWDDDIVSIGLGNGSQSWPFRELPEVAGVGWDRLHDIPVGIVTGTNGKTTTVRLVNHILQCAGYQVGISSTDWIGVNDRIIDRGDWSGPGGARQVLREKEIDVAILETARGGLLRRGLGVTRANAALITNLTEDHLGDYGSQSLQELLDIKWMITRTVEKSGSLILNADDALLVEKSVDFPGELVWFSLQDDNNVINAHLGRNGLAYYLSDNSLVVASGNNHEVICASDAIPITMDGAARHNVANALAAAALTSQLGVSLEHIRYGLGSMSQDQNPGRSNVYAVNDMTVLVDFAHNPAAMQALFDMAQALPAKRRLLAFGQAGDRPDDLIQELARQAWAIGLDAAIISELPMYHRGREYGDVYDIIKNELVRCGLPVDSIQHFDEELDSLQAAIDWAQPGDLVIMLALGGSEPIHQKLLSISTG